VIVRWPPEAVRGLTAQLDSIAEHDACAAVAVGDAVHAAVGRLARYPGLGRHGRVAGTREVVVTGTPYVIVCRLEPDVVMVLRVLHGVQGWPPV